MYYSQKLKYKVSKIPTNELIDKYVLLVKSGVLIGKKKELNSGFREKQNGSGRQCKAI